MYSRKIQQIFQAVQKQSSKNTFSYEKMKVIRAISNCRTPTMGGFVQRCDDCNHTEAYFHSCRNRHCPICQGAKQTQWVEKQSENSLPLQYFHVVFTLPAELNTPALANPNALYALLFKASADTIATLAAEDRFLGAQPGFTSVLHTWGSNLQFHPHVHCIVVGGGLSTDKKRFVKSKKSFFLPVKAMSQVFKGKFLDAFKKLVASDKLLLSKDLKKPIKIKNFLNKLYNTGWVVYCKKPFKSCSHVIRYLGRYTHRVAISESRVLSYNPDSGQVRFKWKDYRDKSRMKVMTLSDTEFVRRFLLHVLPRGFMKIRHYGFLSNRARKERIELCRKLLNATKPQRVIKLFKDKFGSPKSCCPECGSIAFNLVYGSHQQSTPLQKTGTGP